MWTIFNSEGKAVANSDLQPDQSDLALRGENAVFHLESIPLSEAVIDGEGAKRKPMVSLSAAVKDLTATISVSCSDNSVSEIPLLISDVRVSKPQGEFSIIGEAGVRILVNFERDMFRGNCLEVIF